MSKRYSGKSFKDSSVMKKPKFIKLKTIKEFIFFDFVENSKNVPTTVIKKKL